MLVFFDPWHSKGQRHDQVHAKATNMHKNDRESFTQEFLNVVCRLQFDQTSFFDPHTQVGGSERFLNAWALVLSLSRLKTLVENNRGKRNPQENRLIQLVCSTASLEGSFLCTTEILKFCSDWCRFKAFPWVP